MSGLANPQLGFLEQRLADGGRIGPAGAQSMLLDVLGECDGVSLGFAEYGSEQRNDELHWSLVVVIKDEHDRFCTDAIHKRSPGYNQSGKEQKQNIIEWWFRQATGCENLMVLPW